MDRWFIDYRTNKLVQNLGTTGLCDFDYDEVVVNDHLAGFYDVKYDDKQGRHLTIGYSQKELDLKVYEGPKEIVKLALERHEFTPDKLLYKYKYVSREEFKKLLEELFS